MRSVWYKYYIKRLLTPFKGYLIRLKTSKVRKMYEKDLVKYRECKVKFLCSNESTRQIVHGGVYRVTDWRFGCATVDGYNYALSRFSEITCMDYYKKKHPEVFN